MNVSLFSQSLAVIFFGLIVGITVYLCSKIDLKLRLKVLALMVFSALVLSIILVYLTAWLTQSGNELPNNLWLMAFPFSFSLFILPAILLAHRYIKKHTPPKKSRKKIVEEHVTKTAYLVAFSSLNVILGLAFMLLAVNGYYHYYPTLNTVFNIGTPRTLVLSGENKVVLQYSTNESSANKSSIESAIYNNDPTTSKGKLYGLDIPGKVSKFKTRGGWLYVPSIAFNSTSLVKLPVLVMLPGSPGIADNMMFGAGLNTALSQLAATHHGITPLVYVADDNGSTFNDTECVNSSKGNVETYLTVDVPNYIKSHFNVSDNPANWAIGGISMGGTCAVMLTLANPNVYHYFVDLGGEQGPTFNAGSPEITTKILFNGSVNEYNLHQPIYLLAKNKYKGMGGFFGNGTGDILSVTSGIALLYNTTKNDGFDVVHETVNGDHTFNTWSKLVKESLPWISNRIGATECTETVVCQ